LDHVSHFYKRIIERLILLGIETDSYTGKRALRAEKALGIHSEITIKVHSETMEIKKSE